MKSEEISNPSKRNTARAPRGLLSHAGILRAGFLACLLLVPAGSARAGYKVSQDVDRVIEFTGESLIVQNSRGEIVVDGGGAEGRVILTATKRVYANSEDKANRYIKRVEIRSSEEDGTLIVEVKYPDKRDDGSILKHLFGESTRSQVELRLIVPSEMNVTVVTASADVQVSSLRGDELKIDGSSGEVGIESIECDVEVDVSSGDVSARSIKGNVSVEGSSGDLRFSDIDGNLWAAVSSGDVYALRVSGIIDARTQSGSFEILRCQGDITLRGSSGDVVIRETSGSIEAKTSSGDVEIRVTPVDSREYVVTTASGDVDFSYFPGVGYSLLIRTANGEISASLPIEISTINRTTLKGQVGQGDARVQIETASGDIDIEELELELESKD